MYAKVKLLGHPMHPMLIAFPVAFYTSTLVGFILFAATTDAFWLKLTIAANVAGVGMGLVAALPGLVDLLFGVPRGTSARATGWLHAGLNVIALACFAVTLAMYAGEWSGGGDATASVGIVLGSAGVAFTILAGFQGWKLVQDHHVGVRLTPEQQRVEPVDATQLRRVS